MNGYKRNANILLCILFIVLVSTSSINEISLDYKQDLICEETHSVLPTSFPINYTEDQNQACSSVIVTGNATRDGRAILMKNRDLIDERMNIPVYTPATANTYAYVGVNTNTMGINEKGLAVMNTYLPALAGSEPITGNVLLNQRILELFESVSDVAHALNNSYSIIGPVYRASLGNIATCVGVIDRFGVGAFFEISNTKAYVQYVINGYDTRANHPRIFPGAASGPNGRDQYLLDALDEVYSMNGYISPKHVMQNVSRYVHHKELGTANFSIDGEACNPNTVATMVAVSGDERYDGILNCMWTACGSNPIVGVFVPSMVYAEFIPESIEDLWLHTQEKYQSARARYSNSISWLLFPERVREVQKFAFFAEDFTVNAYEQLMTSVPEMLSDSQIKETISAFVEVMDNYTSEIFTQENMDVQPPLPINFQISSTATSTTTSPTGPTTTHSITTNLTSPTYTPWESSNDTYLLSLTMGVTLGFALVMSILIIKRRFN
ncbi:MAG: hypothetical protein AM326_09495 [Candidatus Thorarchaeota archaeon SMTZ-45]|nr:MAG: hypothetical protein AM325_02485 [Candidatus Thorarchaeota archaeon SMTZ1-45]KXH74839.1 MAG: hypothetical protein AM326_09495 [Candidatus Thorarchaeota archaeon SMTZ-45]